VLQNEMRVGPSVSGLFTFTFSTLTCQLWEGRGTDNGSCMTGDCHVQFCEGLWVKLRGLLSR
jgi:hypothetical protein